MTKRLLAALALLPALLSATPTRVLTLDNQQMLVPDDYDATQFYHLAPNFKDRVYADILSGKSRGWAFLDAKLGTLVLWWNNDLHSRALFGAQGSGNLGYQLLDLYAPLAVPQTPTEGRILAPNVQASAGFGSEITDSLNIGLCVQWAETRQSRESSAAAGGALNPADPLSRARYLSPGYYPSLSVTSVSNLQSSQSLGLAPSMGYRGARYALDMKYEMLWTGIRNSHHEELSDFSGSTGSLSQGLEDKSIPSWDALAKYRLSFGDGAFVAHGGYGKFNLSTRHSQNGSFAGPAFNAPQLAGFSHTDAEEDFTLSTWDGMLGWTQAFDKSRHLLVLGLGVKSALSNYDSRLYAPRSAGSGGYNDLVSASRTTAESQSLSVPLLIGAEVEISRFAKANAVCSRNLYSASSSSRGSESFNAAGLSLGATNSKDTSDLNPEWTLGTGLGFYFGNFSVDLALNSAFFASSGGWVNPAAQSSLSWSY